MTFAFTSHYMMIFTMRIQIGCVYPLRITSRPCTAYAILSNNVRSLGTSVTMLLVYSLAAFLTVSSCSAASIFQRASPVVNQTTCDGKQFTYQYLAGYGFIPSNARDKYGDTIGGIGSSIALDRSSWKKKSKSGKDYYTGVLYVLPDRGWYNALLSLLIPIAFPHFLNLVLKPPSPIYELLYSRSTPLFIIGTPKAPSTTRTGCMKLASRSRPMPPRLHLPPPHQISSSNT